MPVFRDLNHHLRMPVSLKRRQHLRAIAHQRQIGYSKYGHHATTSSMSEGDSCNGEGSDTDCDVSDNESDVLEIEEESESENDLSGHRKRV